MHKLTGFSQIVYGFIVFGVVLLAGAVAIASRSSNNPHEFSGKVRLILPKVIYAVPGVETNVYFDNLVVVTNPTNYVFDVTCPIGVQQTDRWTYKPDGTKAGNSPFLFEIRDETNAIIACAHSNVCVLPENSCADVNISCLMIGDSLTQAAIYPQRILDLYNGSANPRLKLIGSRGEGLNRFEGYGGWTAKRFATHYTDIAHTGDYKQCGSPFIYKDPNSPPTLDFVRYCSEFNGGKAPDVVTILLGCNDTFLNTDENIEESIDTMFKNYDILIRVIRNASKDTIIGVIPPPPPAASQDAFGTDDNGGQTFWQYKRNQHRLAERMMGKYGNSDDQKIFLVPVYINLDCMNNYPKDKNGKLCNSVHPSEQGYNQIGDTIYCWLKAVTYPGIK